MQQGQMDHETEHTKPILVFGIPTATDDAICARSSFAAMPGLLDGENDPETIR